ncbi:MAG: EF-P lysine aminoacylase GenX, partial [Rhodospirillaceae bacterium]|nr:EF-P lysine aminoacylase GenX [Rhodospirillaceae bacterium]
LRDFFASRDFVEVETPALQVSPGLEPHLKAFATKLEDPFGGDDRPMYLHTSPEFAMKKLLVAGEPRMFQFARAFRNGERSPTHHPEFTLLEWYRAGATYCDLMTDCRELFAACADSLPETKLSWQGKTCDINDEWRFLTVAEAFTKYCGIDLLATALDPLAPDAALLAVAGKAKLNMTFSPEDRWEDIFFKIFLDHIEPNLGVGAPMILYDYPLSMAALSRVHVEAPRLAERFEVYICGLELANGFSELTDPVEQRRRFEADMDLKQRLYGSRYPIDEDFLDALTAGMPESAGIALGFDRLIMLFTGAAHIEDVLWAPVD